MLLPNKQVVGASTHDVQVKKPLTAIGPADSMLHAAYIVVAAEWLDGNLDFDTYLAQVRQEAIDAGYVK